MMVVNDGSTISTNCVSQLFLFLILLFYTLLFDIFGESQNHFDLKYIHIPLKHLGPLGITRDWDNLSRVDLSMS